MHMCIYLHICIYTYFFLFHFHYFAHCYWVEIGFTNLIKVVHPWTHELQWLGDVVLWLRTQVLETQDLCVQITLTSVVLCILILVSVSSCVKNSNDNPMSWNCGKGLKKEKNISEAKGLSQSKHLDVELLSSPLISIITILHLFLLRQWAQLIKSFLSHRVF